MANLRHLQTRKGRSVESPYSDREAVDKLQILVDSGELTGDFARSLVQRCPSWGSINLSADQLVFVHILVVEHRDRVAASVAPEKPRKLVSAGDFDPVYALLHVAGQKLKYPKIRLETDDGLKVVLSVAGKKSRCPGVINVTDGGRFGENVWYGRIDQDGNWSQPRGGVPVSVQEILSALAADPVKVATLHGRKFGNCCFCAKELTDKRSIGVGYGPTCAKKWCLPWGGAEGADEAADQASGEPEYPFRNESEGPLASANIKPGGEIRECSEHGPAYHYGSDSELHGECTECHEAYVRECEDEARHERCDPEFNRGGGHY